MYADVAGRQIAAVGVSPSPQIVAIAKMQLYARTCGIVRQAIGYARSGEQPHSSEGVIASSVAVLVMAGLASLQTAHADFLVLTTSDSDRGVQRLQSPDPGRQARRCDCRV